MLGTYTCRVCASSFAQERLGGRPPTLCSDECRAEANRRNVKAWQAANPERTAENAARTWAGYYARNRERLIDRVVAYQADNREAWLTRRRELDRQRRIDDRPERWCVHCGDPIAQTKRLGTVTCGKKCNDAKNSLRRKMAARTGVDLSDPVSRFALAERDGWLCGICDGPVDRSLRHPDPFCASIDHIWPVVRGGTNDPTNLQLAHLRCNISKRHFVAA